MRAAAALAAIFASPAAFASTGCTSVNNGDFDLNGIVALGANVGGDFDAGDSLRFATTGNAGLFTLLRVGLPSVQILTWTGADSGDYPIPTTGTYAFVTALTLGQLLPLPIAPATLTVTCTAAPPPDPGNPDPGNPDPGNPDPGNPDPGNPDPGNPDPGNPDPGNPDPGNPDPGNPDPGNPDPGNPDPGPNGTAIAARVDRLLAGGLFGAADDATATSPIATDIRRDFLVTREAQFQNRVTALELLYAVDPSDALVSGKLVDARLRLAAIRRELGQGGAPAPVAPPAAMPWVDPAPTASVAPAASAASMMANGDGMALKLRPSPGVETSLVYRQMTDTGADAMRGWTVTGTQSFDAPASGALSGGLFATLRYSSADGDGAVTRTTAYGVGVRTAIALGGRLALRASAQYERGDNTATVDSATGTFASDRLKMTADLSGSAWIGAMRLTPHLGVSYEEMWRASYTDSAATLIPGAHSAAAKIIAENEIAYSLALRTFPRLLTLHPYVRGGFEWTLSPEEILYRAGGGFRLYWAAQAWLALSGVYFQSGSGNGYEAGAELNLPLFQDSGGTLQVAANAGSSGASASARAILPLH
ncbi:MAG: autotransporter domain-containing protein [Bauldia sp.]